MPYDDFTTQIQSDELPMMGIPQDDMDEALAAAEYIDWMLYRYQNEVAQMRHSAATATWKRPSFREDEYDGDEW